MFKTLAQLLKSEGVEAEERRRRYEIWKSKNVMFAREFLTQEQWEEFIDLAFYDSFDEPCPEFRGLCASIDRMRKR